MGIGDWANPQSPIPNPQSPNYQRKHNYNNLLILKYKISHNNI